MTDTELSRLSRKELLEMLLRLSEENQELKAKLEQAESALKDRQIKIDSAGSLAEASMMLNGVFEAAQAACRQYTENIEALSQRQEAVCARREQESLAAANALLETAKKQQAATIRETEAMCAEMVSQAKAQSEAYWSDVAVKLDKFYAEHAGLRELLGIVTQRTPQEQEAGL